MKKILTFAIYVIAMCICTTTYAQGNLNVNITEIDDGEVLYYCTNQFGTLTFTKDVTCQDTVQWSVTYLPNGTETTYSTDEITIPLNTSYDAVEIVYEGCYTYKGFGIIPIGEIQEPWDTQYAWKRMGESTTLRAYAPNVTSEWSTGVTAQSITVTEPGIYWVHMYIQCDELWDTIQVCDNCEIQSASVDPESNHNLVTWETSPEQSEYISQVIINRDGVDITTVPYTDGQFLDNIGSDLAARIYTITGISTDGTVCPIQSLQRGTIHMAFLPDINGNVEMTWNAPHLGGAPIHVGRFEICEYDPNTMEIAVIDFVSPSTMSYSCNQSMFNYGYPLIRAIIQEGRGEKDMLSNRTEDLVGLNEVEGKSFKIYPNPAKDRVTIEGTGTAIITNNLGQTILTQEIEGKATIELPQGLYLVKLNGATRKIVVE